MQKKKTKRTRVEKNKQKVQKVACGSYETWWAKPSWKEDKQRKAELPEKFTPQDSCWKFE
jgi:hypothetical protein